MLECWIVKGQDQIFSAVKESRTKIQWAKILTAVVGGSTGDYVVSPLANARSWMHHWCPARVQQWACAMDFQQ